MLPPGRRKFGPGLGGVAAPVSRGEPLSGVKSGAPRSYGSADTGFPPTGARGGSAPDPPRRLAKSERSNLPASVLRV